MILIIGGAFQGKLAYALKAYNLTENDVCDLAISDPVPGCKCYRHLEALSRRNNDITRFLPLFEEILARRRNLQETVTSVSLHSKLCATR